jgi:hypothetical protein
VHGARCIVQTSSTKNGEKWMAVLPAPQHSRPTNIGFGRRALLIVRLVFHVLTLTQSKVMMYSSFKDR